MGRERRKKKWGHVTTTYDTRRQHTASMLISWRREEKKTQKWKDLGAPGRRAQTSTAYTQIERIRALFPLFILNGGHRFKKKKITSIWYDHDISDGIMKKEHTPNGYYSSKNIQMIVDSVHSLSLTRCEWSFVFVSAPQTYTHTHTQPTEIP